MTDPRPLTPKQQRFVEEYLIDLNATQAAIRAGYSARTAKSIGQENLTKPVIAAAIAAAKEARSERVQVDQDYVLGNLMEIVERCMERAPVMVRDRLDGRKFVQKTDDDDRNVWQFEPTPAINSLGLLGKHLKLFTEKFEHSVDDKLAKVLQDIRSRRAV